MPFCLCVCMREFRQFRECNVQIRRTLLGSRPCRASEISLDFVFSNVM